jgi:sec-independent protein translocase protein TatC
MDNEALFTPEIQGAINKYYPYLMEVRKRLLFVASMFIIAGLVGFFYYERIVTILLNLLDVPGVNVVFTSPFQFVTLAINSGILVGMAIMLPLAYIQLMSFLKPALTKKEYKLIIGLVPLSIFLFIVGFIFGIVIMRFIITIFYEKSVQLEVGNFLDISLLLSKIVLTGVLMGVAFQFPIIMTILMRLKVVKYSQFSSQRFLAYGLALVFAAFLPPTDILSLVLLTVPLIMLFEITLLSNKLILKSHLLE